MTDNTDAVMAFYQEALTVNTAKNPAEVLNKILADNFVSYGSVDSKTKEKLIAQVGFFWQLIPDLKWEPVAILSSGNKVTVRSVASGTPKGDFMGLPTDGTKKFQIMTIDIHKIEDGKITEVHHLEDWGTAMKQLKS
jgi:steroid delta-isomerase-like uncharacterized protein